MKSQNICIKLTVKRTVSAFLLLSRLTLTKPLGPSESMKTWLQESSIIRSEMNFTGVALTSWRLTHRNMNKGQAMKQLHIWSHCFDILLAAFYIYHALFATCETSMSVMLCLTQSHRDLQEAGCLVAAKRWCPQEAQLWPHSRSQCEAFRCVCRVNTDKYYLQSYKALHSAIQQFVSSRIVTLVQ